MKKEDIIKKHTGLVRNIVSKYKGNTIPQEDLMQEGIIGLLQALEKFDEEKDVKFSTYATYWIKKKILAAVENEEKQSLDSIHLIEETVTDKSAVQKKQSESQIEIPENFPVAEKKVLRSIFIEELTLKEIAEKMQITRERVRQLKQKALRRMRAKRTTGRDS